MWPALAKQGTSYWADVSHSQYYLYTIVWPVTGTLCIQSNTMPHSIDGVRSWVTPFIIIKVSLGYGKEVPQLLDRNALSDCIRQNSLRCWFLLHEKHVAPTCSLFRRAGHTCTLQALNMGKPSTFWQQEVGSRRQAIVFQPSATILYCTFRYFLSHYFRNTTLPSTEKNLAIKKKKKKKEKKIVTINDTVHDLPETMTCWWAITEILKMLYTHYCVWFTGTCHSRQETGCLTMVTLPLIIRYQLKCFPLGLCCTLLEWTNNWNEYQLSLTTPIVKFYNIALLETRENYLTSPILLRRVAFCY